MYYSGMAFVCHSHVLICVSLMLIKLFKKPFLYLFFLSAVWVCGCTEDMNEDFVSKPKPLLSQEKMISFLIDLHLTEAKMNYLDIRQTDSADWVFRNYEEHLFEKHRIDPTTYYQSYQYYLAHMKQMENIYAAVVDSLSVISSREKMGN